MLHGTPYQDLGPDHFDRRPVAAKAQRPVVQLAWLGYAVHIRPAAAACGLHHALVGYARGQRFPGSEHQNPILLHHDPVRMNRTHDDPVAVAL
jgi:hypothetical protein